MWISPWEASSFQGGWFGVLYEQPACHSPPAPPSRVNGLLKAHHCHLGWFHLVTPHDEKNVVQELHFFACCYETSEPSRIGALCCLPAPAPGISFAQAKMWFSSIGSSAGSLVIHFQ